MDMPMDYHVCDAIFKHYRRHMPKLANIMPNWKLFCWRYRMICFTSSLIKQLYHFASDLDRLLLHLAGSDIVNNLFKYRVSYRHVTFMIEISELLVKSCATCDLLFVNIQRATACSLKKVNLKLKLLYQLSHFSYVISLNFAGYVVWILTFKVWKLDSNLYYHGWITAIF